MSREDQYEYEMRKRRSCPVCFNDLGVDVMAGELDEDSNIPRCDECGWTPVMSPDEVDRVMKAYYENYGVDSSKKVKVHEKIDVDSYMCKVDNKNGFQVLTNDEIEEMKEDSDYTVEVKL